MLVINKRLPIPCMKLIENRRVSVSKHLPLSLAVALLIGRIETLLAATFCNC